MPEQEYRKEQRTVPTNDLDLTMMTINSVWGKDEIPLETSRILSKFFEIKDSDGKPRIMIKNRWNTLGWMSRDLRLGNLSSNPMNDEIGYVDYHMVLANDMLNSGMIETFLDLLARIASKLELSQSKGGFLRKRINTFTQESYKQEMEPPKKSLFGTSKKNKGVY